MILQINELISSRYKIIKFVSSGGMGEVYAAFDNILNRKVALKLFLNSDDLSSARIQREAKILSTLSHPNIVSIFDVGTYKNLFYFILEFIEGHTLKDEILNKQIPLPKVVKYLFIILSSLEYIHSKGIIHRDLKPSNIIVDSQLDTLRITDILIGKPVVDSDNTISNITLEGHLIGTLAYMSPEQFQMAKVVTTKSDIYSLGLIMLEILLGRLPYDSGIQDLFQRSEYDYLKLIKEKRPETPNIIIELITSFLSDSVDKRPSATEALSLIYSNKAIIEMANSKKIEDFTESEHEEEINISKTETQYEKSKTEEIYVTQLKDKPGAKGTGFFESEEQRYKEFSKSVDFYRSHLNSDYITLLSQARLTFWLWFSSFVIGIAILITASIMLINNQLAAGAITLLSETFIYFIQNAFKVQESYYREQAEKKTKHLEIGNYWNLITQSIDALPTWDKKEQKLIELVDVLNKYISGGKKE